jgi:hypothetical protein
LARKPPWPYFTPLNTERSGHFEEDDMRDEMDARIWAEHHHDFSEMVHKALEPVRAAFNSLHRIQFDAPWKKKRSC